MADETDAMEKEDAEAVFRWVKKGKKEKKKPIKSTFGMQKSLSTRGILFL